LITFAKSKKIKTMKRVLYLSIFLLAFNTLFAQDEKREKWFSWGAGLAVNIPVMRDLSDEYRVKAMQNMDFGANFRFKYDFFYAQTGLYYQLQKNTVRNMETGQLALIESDYLIFPVAGGFRYKIMKIFTIRAFGSIAYAPLVYLSKNEFNFGRETVTPHLGYWGAGIGLDVLFMCVDLSYRGSINDVYVNGGKKSGTINIALYFNL
jgi:hypothetical protein